MADSRVLNAATSSSRTPGSAFYPSEEELICYYLASKNSDGLPHCGIDVIKEIDLYRHNPFDLPETASFQFGKEGRRRHWYCYVRRLETEPRFRAAGDGYWKRRNGKRNVIGGGVRRVVVGTRRTFVFYLGNGSSTAGARKTEWIMHEYESTGHPKASFVLCRVFAKSDPRKKGSDRESTAFCENCLATELRLGAQHESAARLHGSGVQRGVAVTSEANVDNAIDDVDDIYSILLGQSSEPEDENLRNPVAQQMKPFKDSSWPAMATDGLAAQRLEDISNDAFVELNDLTWPPC